VPRSAGLKRALASGVALVCGGVVLTLALQHPLFPLALPVGLCLAWVFWVWRPSWPLFWVPALLPVASFMPWTGWWLWEEFDLLVLTALSAQYTHLAWQPGPPRVRGSPTLPGAVRAMDVACVLLALSLVWGVWRAWAPLGGSVWPDLWAQGFQGDYDQAGQTWRVAKSTLWALLWWPVLRRQCLLRGAEVARLMSAGMVAGLACVVLWAVWERAVYPGLFEFSSAYRTTAGFWEMHVGGGAIDAYLALALPFAVWALWRAQQPLHWCGLACLVLGLCYTVLTTFSRGVYGVALVACWGLWWWQRRLAGGGWGGTPVAQPAWRRPAQHVLLVLLLAQVVGVAFMGSFLGERLQDSGRDVQSRWSHWSRAWALPQNTVDRWLGLGWGRWTAEYSQAPGGGRVGQVQWRPEHSRVHLSGPAEARQWGGHFGLTQRVRLQDSGTYRVQLQAQVGAPTYVLLSLCEQHLLYPVACQSRVLALSPSSVSTASAWFDLSGESLGQRWAGPRSGVFSVSVLSHVQTVVLYRVQLRASTGEALLHNPDFAQGLQHWMPLVRQHFQPWHADNAYLDVLIERGVLGLMAVMALALAALWALWQGVAARQTLAGVWLTALASVVALGLVISLTELPRVGFMILSVFLTSVAFAHGFSPEADVR